MRGWACLADPFGLSVIEGASRMPVLQQQTVDANIAGLEHSELWNDFWRAAGSGSALNGLMEAYTPLVHRVLERISIRLPPHVDVADLLQSALVGLYNAINRFDPAHGVQFETFARPRIQGAVMDELRAMDHVSRSTRALLQRIEKAICDWQIKHHAPPGEADLAHVLEISPEELAAALAQGQPFLSLDKNVMQQDDNPLSLKDILADVQTLAPDEIAARNEMRVHLRKAFLALSVREQQVLYLFYFQELRLSEIAEVYEVTAARICQIHAMAVLKLRALLQKRGV